MKDSFEIKGIVSVEKYKVPSWLPDYATEQEVNGMINRGEMSPFATSSFENTVLLTGWTELLKLIKGESANHFDGTYTLIGIGDDATGAAEAQTDLISTSGIYKSMISGFPTTPSSQTIQFKSVFLATEANFAWEEYVIKQSTSAVCLSRGVSSLGTKTNSEIWYLTWTWGK